MPSIVRDFNIPLSLSIVPIAIGKVAYVLLLVPGGMIVDSVGPRRTVLVGVAILAISLILYAFIVNSFNLLIVFHIIMAASAAVSGVPVYSIFIAQWFNHENLGLAMGFVLAGYSAAGTLFPMLLGAIADANGWRAAMASMATILLFFALPVSYFFLLEKPQDDEEPSATLATSLSNDEADVDINSSNIQLLQSIRQPQQEFEFETSDPRTWTFFGFSLSYLMLQYCNGCFLENIMFYLTLDLGMSLASASVYFSSINLAAFCAKIVGGHLGDRYDRFYVAAAASAICAIAIAFLFVGGPGLDENFFPLLTPYPFSIMVFSILYGFGYGASFNSLYALVPIVFGKKNLGRTQSSFFGIGLAGNAAGSVLTSIIRSKYGSYQRAFLVSFLTCIGNFLVFNATRVSLGGSMKGMKQLEAKGTTTSGFFTGIDELDAAEEAARLRVGDISDSGTDPRITPHGSIPNFQSQGAIPSSESLTNGIHAFTGTRLHATPRTISFLNADTPEASPVFDNVFPESPTDRYQYSRRLPQRFADSGMVPNRGYPIPRDWSSSSLRRNVPSVTDLSASILPPGAESSAPSSAIPIPNSDIGVRRSSTLEAMINSGILSASLESIGYLGTRATLGGRTNRNPPVGLPSSANTRRAQGGNTGRTENIQPSYGTMPSSEITPNPDDSANG